MTNILNKSMVPGKKTGILGEIISMNVNRFNLVGYRGFNKGSYLSLFIYLSLDVLGWDSARDTELIEPVLFISTPEGAMGVPYWILNALPLIACHTWKKNGRVFRATNPIFIWLDLSVCLWTSPLYFDPFKFLYKVLLLQDNKQVRIYTYLF